MRAECSCTLRRDDARNGFATASSIASSRSSTIAKYAASLLALRELRYLEQALANAPKRLVLVPLRGAGAGLRLEGFAGS